jgi:hypothetical protein
MAVPGKGHVFQRDFSMISHHLPRQLFPNPLLPNMMLNLMWNQYYSQPILHPKKIVSTFTVYTKAENPHSIPTTQK